MRRIARTGRPWDETTAAELTEQSKGMNPADPGAYLDFLRGVGVHVQAPPPSKVSHA